MTNSVGDMTKKLGDREPEEIQVDEETGGRKGSKELRFDLIPVKPLEQLARVYGRGAKKYAERNWERGYKWSLSFAAMMRHAWAFWRGETYDKETGLHHMAHAAWHCFTLLEYTWRYPEKDDRVIVRDHEPTKWKSDGPETISYQLSEIRSESHP